jgi:hypothetical protein
MSDVDRQGTDMRNSASRDAHPSTRMPSSVMRAQREKQDYRNWYPENPQ